MLLALQNAFFRLPEAPSLEGGAAATVMGGGDSDASAPIAGALLGALYGCEAVPLRWRPALLS